MQPVGFIESCGGTDTYLEARLAAVAYVQDYAKDLYEDDRAVSDTIKKDGTAIISDCLGRFPKGSSVVDDPGHSTLAELMKKQLSGRGINSEVYIVNFTLTEKSAEDHARSRGAVGGNDNGQNVRSKKSVLDELRKNEPAHGELKSISYSSYSSGMMMNSDARNNYSISEINGDWILTASVKPAFKNETVKTYKIGERVIKQLEETVKKHGLPAFGELRYEPPYQIMDFSSSCSISMVFDDRSTGGGPYVYRSVNADALRHFGSGDAISEIYAIITTCTLDAELLSEKENARGGMMGSFMNIGSGTDVGTPQEKTPAVPDPPAGAWTCKNCGYNANTGKFCCECGSIKEV